MHEVTNLPLLGIAHEQFQRFLFLANPQVIFQPPARILIKFPILTELTLMLVVLIECMLSNCSLSVFKVGRARLDEGGFGGFCDGLGA